MPDFTSALYLGLRHATASLAPWRTLAAGRPAALGEVTGAEDVARRLARLAGAARALLYPSTLHLFLDVVDVLARRPIRLLWDARLYPVPRWAIERAVGRGVPARAFDQHRPGALGRPSGGRAPVVVTTGFCPGCGGPAPLAALLREVEDAGGFLVVDDTQMFGLVGGEGGGSARRLKLASDRLIVGASLAKAFGAPLAFVAAAAPLIDQLERHGPARWHASAVSAAAVSAAARALDVNAARGDQLRAQVAALSARLGAGLLEIGLGRGGPPLPIRSTIALPRAVGQALHAAVDRRGVRCLLQRGCRGGAMLTFLLTAAHDPAAVDAALAAVRGAWTAVGSGGVAPGRGDAEGSPSCHCRS